MTIEVFDRLREIPPYDDDMRLEFGFPPAVEACVKAFAPPTGC